MASISVPSSGGSRKSKSRSRSSSSSSENIRRSFCYVDREAFNTVRERILRLYKVTLGDEPNFLSKEQRKIGTATDGDAFIPWTGTSFADYIDGDIIIREISLLPLACTRDEICGQFYDQRGAFLRVAIALDVRGRVSGDIYVPDIALLVLGASILHEGAQNIYPVIIVEVGCSQKPRDIAQRALFYIGPDCPWCEFYISIVRYNIKNGLQCLVATVYDRVVGAENPIDIISFGTDGLWHNATWSHDHNATWSHDPRLRGVGVGNNWPPNNAPGNPFYTLTFPSPRVFGTRVGGVPAGVPMNYTLDLFPILQELSQPMEEA